VLNTFQLIVLFCEQDEMLVVDKKIVLEITDLVKWFVSGPLDWGSEFDSRYKTDEISRRRFRIQSSDAVSESSTEETKKNKSMTCFSQFQYFNIKIRGFSARSA